MQQNNEQLVSAVRSPNPKIAAHAYRTLLENNKGLIHRAVMHITCAGDGRSAGLYEAGREGLVVAMCKFDPTRGCKFVTPALWEIRGALTQYISTHRGEILYGDESLFDRHTHVQLCDDVINEQDHAIAVATIFEQCGLSDREQLVLRHRFGLDGETEKNHREIGALLGLGHSSVQKIEKAALERLQRNAVARTFLHLVQT
ncbi:MAG: sigma-70 family RNA polymerase sigma factor [Candidatus Magasanikbacteria bacterium]|nr:sigma-70 family RNA polymerase sigma factor [Candidatus Magasanikbacteria bacterium]